MDRTYEEAFAEVDEILKKMPIELFSKIPIQFRQIISANKSKNYKIDIQTPLVEENLKEETIIILGLIYRDFLATPEEREELKTQDIQELRKIEEELQEKYNMDKLFKKRKVEKNTSNDNFSTEMIVYKEESFIKKIFNFIKSLFNKK